MQDVRGALPQKLTALMLAQTEVARAAVMWCSGEVYAPLAQLHDLANHLEDVRRLTLDVAAEARRVYRDTREAQVASGEPREGSLGRWDDVA